jgi:hypothetical protein
LLLRRFRMPKARICSTLDDEVLVDPPLAAAMKAGGLGGCLGDVRDATSRALLPVHQLIPQRELPPFAPSTVGVVRERPCPACDRDGYFGIPHQPITLRYERLAHDLIDLDLLATYERFGNSRLRDPFRKSVFAAPLYVAGEKLTDILDAERVKGIELQPVVIG